ncbi:MAG: serine/threonine protein kinase [Nostoc sp. TH1S01]|nr:serine/threonine protein kinase [Nostoc sp. TH1S01]
MTCCLDPACHNPPHSEGVIHCSSCGGPLIALRNRYRPIQSIGGGGFGKTYLAEDIDKLNERCVIKQFAPQVQGTGALKKATELFEQEAKRLQQLGKHPQIPTLLAYFNEDKRLYLVQEFIEGQNLLKEVQQLGHFTEEKVREVLLDLLDILKTVHQEKVIHRDVKPENIIRHNSGKLVLIDFGASKQLTATTITQGGTQIGSFGYAPMEQMQGGEAHPASDLYSVGATCFHLLSGIHPWELWKRQGYGWVVSWRDHLRQSVSQEFGRILDKLLQEESHQRYESVEELLKDLNPPPKPSITKIQPDFADFPPTQLPVNPQPILYPPSAPLAIPSKAQAPITGILQELSGNSKVSSQPSKNAKLAKRLLLGAAITLVGIPVYSYVSDRFFPPSPIIANSGLASKASEIFFEKTLPGHSELVRSLAVSPDNQILVSASETTIKVWNLATEEQIYSLTGNFTRFSSVAISPDSKTFACGSETTIKVWKLATGELIHTLTGHKDIVRSVVFSPDGKTLASASRDTTIKLWDLATGEQMGNSKEHDKSVRSVVFSPDGKNLVSASRETIKLWDLATGEQISNLKVNFDRFSAVVFSPDYKALAIASPDTSIKVLNIKTGKVIHILKDHLGSVNSIVFSQDAQTLVSGSNDKTIKVWNLKTGEPVRTLNGDYGVSSVALSPDAKTIVSGNMDNTIKIWRLP